VRVADDGDVVGAGVQVRPAIEGVDEAVILEAELLEHAPGRHGLLADLPDDGARLRRQEREIDRLSWEEGGDELAGDLAEAVRLGVAEADEATAEVLPEQVLSVGRDGGHHLGDHSIVEDLAMERDEVEADEAEEASELQLVAPERGLDDEAAELAGPSLVEVERRDRVRGARLERLAVEALL